MTETVETDGAGLDPRTLSVVGAGRAGSALATAAGLHGWKVVALAGRAPEQLAAAVGARVASTAAEAAGQARLTLLTVPDPAVSSVAAQIAASGAALHGRVIAHVAASLGPEVLASVRQTGAAVGVAHPLQALAGASSAELLPGSYFRVEGDPDALPLLQEFVATLGGNLLAVSPESRALYHAAAVLAGNAPLALLERATSLLIDAGVEPDKAHDALSALLEGSARNARRRSAAAALTGPVVRNDANTVRAHIEALSIDADARDLYLRLAREMLALAGVSGRESVSAVLEEAETPPRPRIASTRVA